MKEEEQHITIHLIQCWRLDGRFYGTIPDIVLESCVQVLLDGLPMDADRTVAIESPRCRGIFLLSKPTIVMETA